MAAKSPNLYLATCGPNLDLAASEELESGEEETKLKDSENDSADVDENDESGMYAPG
jgi:hypothetical protein